MTWAVILRADCESARVFERIGLTEASTLGRVAVMTDSVHQQVPGFLAIRTEGSKPNRSVWHLAPMADVLHLIHAQDMPEPEARQAFGFAPR